jgi:HAD superfamily hydrolase (TIGR01509 family)
LDTARNQANITLHDRFDLVIFDCDGVLIDSEVISTATLIETLAGHGLPVDLEYVRSTYLGRSVATVKADYRRLSGRELAEGFEAELLARLYSAYQRELRIIDGVRALLDGLPLPFCMATSSGPERARLSLEVVGLSTVFEGRTFSASMVARGKPAPDLFLLAARTLGAAPERCLVIEDSAVGVQSARNAGMTVWRFVGGSHFRGLPETELDAGPDVRVFASMKDVAAALGVQ